MPQIWAPYSIIGLTIAVYSRCVHLNKGPHIKAVIYNAVVNAVAPLWVVYAMCVFQFSLESIQIPKTLRLASGFVLQLWIFTVKAK